MTAPLPIESLWTVKEVATYLNVKRTSVYERCRAGELPHLRIGNLLRFVPGQIRAWAEKKSTTTATNVVPIGGRR